MKPLAIILTLHSLTCLGQDFLTDNLKTSRWIVGEEITAENIKQQKRITLSKLKTPNDSLLEDVTIWTFTNDSIHIKHYDRKSKHTKNEFDRAYGYRLDNGLLKIKIDGNSYVAFTPAIISTGSFILLTRKKRKNKT
ncbi:MAG TPA: hypothetical protein VGD40_22135 [Chryseosolibacter sp.]